MIYKVMKIRALYIIIFAAITGFFVLLVTSGKSPEEAIVGSWKEVSWEYEKVNKTNDGESFTKLIDDNVKTEIMENLIIHKAEVWRFTSDGKLYLHNGNKPSTTLDWKLKGRGHILKLNYQDNKTEYYDLSELNNNKLVLYFDIDLQVKGIVKMTFERI